MTIGGRKMLHSDATKSRPDVIPVRWVERDPLADLRPGCWLQAGVGMQQLRAAAGGLHRARGVPLHGMLEERSWCSSMGARTTGTGCAFRQRMQRDRVGDGHYRYGSSSRHVHTIWTRSRWVRSCRDRPGTPRRYDRTTANAWLASQPLVSDRARAPCDPVSSPRTGDRRASAARG